MEVIRSRLTSKGYKDLGPADLRILNVENILRGGEIMQNLLYEVVFVFKYCMWPEAQRRLIIYSYRCGGQVHGQELRPACGRSWVRFLAPILPFTSIGTDHFSLRA